MSQSLGLKQLTTDELVARCELLTHKLDNVTLERDDLQRDVELLCMQSGSATFNSSSLLQERLYSVESELARLKAQNQKLQVERDGLREDHVHLRQAKRLSDNSYRDALAKSEKLERNLAFYQEQSALAMQDRDRATSDAEFLREQNQGLERTLKAAQGELAHERQLAANLARVQDENAATIVRLEREAADARLVPGLRQQLEKGESAAARLTASLHDVQARLNTTAAELDAAEQSRAELERRLEELAARHADLQATHSATLELHAATVAALEATVTRKTEEVRGGTERIAQLEDEAATGAATIEVLKEKVREADGKARDEMRALVLAAEEDAAQQRAEAWRLRAALEAAQADLEATRGRAEAAEAAIAAAQTAELHARSVSDNLGQKIREVTQEKVELLVEIAELKEQVREGGVEREDPDAWNAWPWKPGYGGGSHRKTASNASNGGTHNKAVSGAPALPAKAT